MVITEVTNQLIAYLNNNNQDSYKSLTKTLREYENAHGQYILPSSFIDDEQQRAQAVLNSIQNTEEFIKRPLKSELEKKTFPFALALLHADKPYDLQASELLIYRGFKPEQQQKEYSNLRSAILSGGDITDAWRAYISSPTIPAAQRKTNLAYILDLLEQNKRPNLPKGLLFRDNKELKSLLALIGDDSALLSRFIKVFTTKNKDNSVTSRHIKNLDSSQLLSAAAADKSGKFAKLLLTSSNRNELGKKLADKDIVALLETYFASCYSVEGIDEADTTRKQQADINAKYDAIAANFTKPKGFLKRLFGRISAWLWGDNRATQMENALREIIATGEGLTQRTHTIISTRFAGINPSLIQKIPSTFQDFYKAYYVGETETKLQLLANYDLVSNELVSLNAYVKVKNKFSIPIDIAVLEADMILVKLITGKDASPSNVVHFFKSIEEASADMLAAYYLDNKTTPEMRAMVLKHTNVRGEQTLCRKLVSTHNPSQVNRLTTGEIAKELSEDTSFKKFARENIAEVSELIGDPEKPGFNPVFKFIRQEQGSVPKAPYIERQATPPASAEAPATTTAAQQEQEIEKQATPPASTEAPAATTTDQAKKKKATQFEFEQHASPPASSTRSPSPALSKSSSFDSDSESRETTVSSERLTELFVAIFKATSKNAKSIARINFFTSLAQQPLTTLDTLNQYAYKQNPLWEMSPEEFEADLSLAKLIAIAKQDGLAAPEFDSKVTNFISASSEMLAHAFLDKNFSGKYAFIKTGILKDLALFKKLLATENTSHAVQLMTNEKYATAIAARYRQPDISKSEKDQSEVIELLRKLSQLTHHATKQGLLLDDTLNSILIPTKSTYTSTPISRSSSSSNLKGKEVGTPKNIQNIPIRTVGFEVPDSKTFGKK